MQWAIILFKNKALVPIIIKVSIAVPSLNSGKSVAVHVLTLNLLGMCETMALQNGGLMCDSGRVNTNRKGRSDDT